MVAPPVPVAVTTSGPGLEANDYWVSSNRAVTVTVSLSSPASIGVGARSVCARGPCLFREHHQWADSGAPLGALSRLTIPSHRRNPRIGSEGVPVEFDPGAGEFSDCVSAA